MLVAPFQLPFRRQLRIMKLLVYLLLSHPAFQNSRVEFSVGIVIFLFSCKYFMRHILLNVHTLT
jgi:hypothetical protein